VRELLVFLNDRSVEEPVLDVVGLDAGFDVGLEAGRETGAGRGRETCTLDRDDGAGSETTGLDPV
jgi:hypothetical protein